MNCETNDYSILSLEQKTTERVEHIIAQLEPTQNSLVNISHVPPETLGHIFQLAVEHRLPRDGDIRFAGIQGCSYNFLFVCRRWYEVALHAPGLWNSWGNNLEDWKQHYFSHMTSVDLVLDGKEHQGGLFDEAVREALKSRAARGLIRKVHLRSPDVDLLGSILSSLTPEGEGIRHSNIQSIVLRDVDLSKFFPRHSFPKLRDLDLFNCAGLNLDHLKSHTMALIRLSLQNRGPAAVHIPTTSQILSLFASNPNIRAVTLGFSFIHDDVGSGHGHQVSLRHLEQFMLVMNFRVALAILQRLELPSGINQLYVGFVDCSLEEIREFVGPYIRTRLQGHGEPRARLSVSVKVETRLVSLKVGLVSTRDRHSARRSMRATFLVTPPKDTSVKEKEELCIKILEPLPQKRVHRLVTNLSTGALEELFVTVPETRTLHLHNPVISNSFMLPSPEGPNAHRKLLPSLQKLHLEYEEPVGGNDWNALVQYLIHQTTGSHSFSRLSVHGKGVHLCLGLQEQIRGLVEHFDYSPDPDEKCPFHRCLD